MQLLRVSLMKRLGIFGLILWFAIMIILMLIPTEVINLKIWISVIIFALCLIPKIGGLPRLFLYVWAFISLFSPQPIFLVVLYILAAPIYIYLDIIRPIRIIFFTKPLHKKEIPTMAEEKITKIVEEPKKRSMKEIEEQAILEAMEDCGLTREEAEAQARDLG